MQVGKLTIRREGAWEAFAVPMLGRVDGETVCRLLNFGMYECERGGIVAVMCHLAGREGGETVRVDLDAFSSVTVTALQKPGRTELTVEPPEAALPE